MMRGREHSEEIAFYNGGGVELAICSKSFRNVMEIGMQRVLFQWLRVVWRAAVFEGL